MKIPTSVNGCRGRLDNCGQDSHRFLSPKKRRERQTTVTPFPFHSILSFQVEEPSQKNIFNVSSRIKDSQDQDRLPCDSIHDSPRRNDRFAILQDALFLQLWDDASPSWGMIQIGGLAFYCAEDFYGVRGVVSDNVFKDTAQIFFGAFSPYNL